MQRDDTPYFALSHDRIDIGHDHFLSPITWTEDERPSAWRVFHPDCRDPTQECESCPWVARRAPNELWTLVSWEPLTVAPSVLCMRCGDHGSIQNGQWVPA